MEYPIYTATKFKNEGRRVFSVRFRHPLKPDHGRPSGRKVCKSLGVDDSGEADRLVGQLNELLATPKLHSLAFPARSEAEA